MPSFQRNPPFNPFSISYLAAFRKEEAKSERNILCNYYYRAKEKTLGML